MTTLLTDTGLTNPVDTQSTFSRVPRGLSEDEAREATAAVPTNSSQRCQVSISVCTSTFATISAICATFSAKSRLRDTRCQVDKGQANYRRRQPLLSSRRRSSQCLPIRSQRGHIRTRESHQLRTFSQASYCLSQGCFRSQHRPYADSRYKVSSSSLNPQERCYHRSSSRILNGLAK